MDSPETTGLAYDPFLSSEIETIHLMRIIAGEAKGKKLLPPLDRRTRPPLDSMRESIFSVLAGNFEGGGVLDLFAGIGAFGLEAVSRGATGAILVDRDRATVRTLEKNVVSLGFKSRCQLLCADALRVPDLSSQPTGSLALVFLDPPFNMFQEPDSIQRVFDRLQEVLASPALTTGADVVLRTPRKSDVACPDHSIQRRVYGESVVDFYTTRAGNDAEDL